MEILAILLHAALDVFAPAWLMGDCFEAGNPRPTPEKSMDEYGDDQTNDTADQEAFEKMLRDHLSPEAIVLIVVFLQTAAFYRPTRDHAQQALREVEWFASALTGMFSVSQFEDLLAELGL